MLKRLLILVFCLVSFPSILKAHDASNNLRDWKRSVVQILITCGENELPYSGTGVLVSEAGHVLTAAHNGNSCVDVTQARVGVIADLYGPTEDIGEATLIFRRADGVNNPTGMQAANTGWQDLALWKINDFESMALDLEPAEFANDVPPLGADLSIIGFPGLPFGYFREVDESGKVLETEPPYRGVGVSVFQTYLMSASARPTEDPYRLQYDGGTMAGLSGAPIFNDSGEVVGIHSGRMVQFISNLIAINCNVPDSQGTCVDVPDFVETYTQPNGETANREVTSVGVNVFAAKNLLDNYSWGTSVWSLPDGFVAEIQNSGSNDVTSGQQQQQLPRYCADGEEPTMVNPQPQRAESSPMLVPSCRRRQGS